MFSLRAGARRHRPGAVSKLGFVVGLTLLGLVGWALAASADARAACPNEALRVIESATALPECRAYEMVSPVDKSGGSVNTHVEGEVAASGERASFFSSASFAGSPSSPQDNLYVARREAGAWVTQSVDAPQLNPHGFVTIATPAATLGLDKVLQGSKIALTPGATEGGSNVYVQDLTTGARTLVATEAGNLLFQTTTIAGATPFAGGTSDWSRLILQTEAQLTPDAIAGAANLYEYAGGQLRLLSYAPGPNGAPIPGHAVGGTQVPFAHPVSADGSRVYFTEGTFGQGRLYLREGGESVAVSASQRAADLGTVASADFRAATVDGGEAFFLSSARLTESATGQVGNALYRYDAATRELTDLSIPTTPGAGPDVQEVMAVSADGSYVYFVAAGILAPGAEENGNANLYVWHDGQVRFIGQTLAADAETFGPSGRLTSPNGRYLGFSTYSPLTGEDVPSPNCPADPGSGNQAESCLDVYLYDYVTDSLRCVSCAGPGAGNSTFGGQVFHGSSSGDRFPLAVLDDGSVFFDSPNRLVPSDGNGVGDAYRWRNGVTELMSTGTDESASNFAGASPDGSNVFIRTRQQLVGQDSDDAIDLYDVRVDGGLASQFPAAAPPPCEGEACRGPQPPAGSSAGLTPSSSTLRGPGNPKSCKATKKSGKSKPKKHSKPKKKARSAAQSRRQTVKKGASQGKKTNKCGGQG